MFLKVREETQLLDYFSGRTFAGRKFGFALFWPIHKSLFPKISGTEASTKIFSCEIRESQVIFDAASKND